MNNKSISIKRALLSVSDKKNIIELARGLIALDIEILSTGGTSKILRDAKIKVTDIASITDFPEIMDGRIKTLHPLVHGGILGKRDTHAEIAEKHFIQWIDLVVVNLYPFLETIQNPTAQFQDAIENIDIGGPAMIRSAAKNVEWVSVVVDPEDYEIVLGELNEEKGLSFTTRKKLAGKAFQYTAHYDEVIYRYLTEENHSAFPHQFNLKLEKMYDLRYGENPHQSAAAYGLNKKPHGILAAKKHQGKLLSYNNIVDADAALSCVSEMLAPSCVIVKHANPCGVASANTIFKAVEGAYAADRKSAFGGVFALNKECTEEIANFLTSIFLEVLIAPSYSKESLEILKNKENLRVLELNSNSFLENEFKFIEGGVLIQNKDKNKIDKNSLQIVTDLAPSDDTLSSLLFAWQVVKHIKSNAILIAKENRTLGIGCGQVSRIDAVEAALRKAGKELQNAVLASDAFFPFRDSIDCLANTGVTAIIQPGGSLRDEEVIAACNEYKIAMVMTGNRCFKH